MERAGVWATEATQRLRTPGGLRQQVKDDVSLHLHSEPQPSLAEFRGRGDAHRALPIATMGSACQKSFIPLESNPDVFNNLIRLLGATDNLFFQDVISLDEPSLLPSPAVALILVFPTTDRYVKHAAAEDSELEQTYNAQSEDVVWLKQTINNACGLYGVLHALCNGGARSMHSKPLVLLSFLLELT